MRKKIFVIASILLMIFSNINANENNYGKYTLSLYVEYPMISEVSKEINSYIILKDNHNETYIIEYDINHNKNEIEVSSSFKSIKIIESHTIGRINDNTIYNNIDEIISQVELKPGQFYLGKKTISYSSSNKVLSVKFYINIKPSRVEANAKKEKIFLYNDLISINTTKGFPISTYKWSYIILDKNNNIIKAPTSISKYQIVDYEFNIKGSEIMTEHEFIRGVEDYWRILLIPNQATGYEKPLEFKGDTLDFKLSAPTIEKVTYTRPQCHGDSATNVKLFLSRESIKKEFIIIEYSSSNNGHQHTDTIDYKTSKVYNLRNIETGTWKLKFLHTKFINKDGKLIDSYSEGNNREYTINIPSPDSLSLLFKDSEKTKCIGDSNGEISYHVIGGTGSKTYTLFSNNTQIESITQDSSEVCTFKDLKAGTYYISTTDANGCKYEKDETITIGEPTPVTLSASTISNPKCQGSYDGVIKYNASGGTGNIKCYLQNLLHEVKDSTYSNSFSGLSAGTYFLCAKDTNNCVSNTIETRLKAPDALNLSLETKNVTINGTNNGRLSATFSGGTGTYTIYYLNKREDYSFPIENLLLGNNLFAGEGSVTLYDSNGCSTSKNYIITEPDTISAIVKQIDFIKCFGDNTASLKIDSIAGGMGGYSVEWNGTDDFTSKETYLGNLSAGYYLVTLKDSVGAKTIYEITIDEPNKINLLSSVTNTACVGEASGSILLNANGGTAPYKFSLNEQYSTNGEYNQLGIGSYNVSVEDENGCATDSIVEVKTLSDINLNVTSSSPSCYNINNGTISISIDNGVRPYYVRCTDDSFLQVENNLELTNLEAGNYNIEVKDALGCIKTAEAILTKPEEFSIELPEKIYLCNEQSKDINIESERVTNVDWYLNNDLIHTGLNNKLTQEGVYRLDFLYDEQCHSLGEIEVDTINKKVDANFLVAAEVPINDDAHLINITPKENYEYVEWIYPTNDAWVYGEDEHSFQLVFLNEGIFQVGMIAHNDKCTASLFKTIKTFTPSGNNASEDNTYHISELCVDKSPNNGKFISYVNLSAKTDVKLYLYNASTGHIIATKEVSGEKSYEIPFSVNATAGEYILLAVAPQWQKSKWIKMIIK